MQPTLWGDPPLPAHNRTATSLAAAESVRDGAATHRGMVLHLLKISGPLTREELSHALGIPIQGICPRVSELLARGKIRQLDETRLTQSMRKAALLEVV